MSRKKKKFKAKSKVPADRVEYSEDERILAKLERVAVSMPDHKDKARSLMMWYLRHHSWTDKQKHLAKTLAGLDNPIKSKASR